MEACLLSVLEVKLIKHRTRLLNWLIILIGARNNVHSWSKSLTLSRHLAPSNPMLRTLRMRLNSACYQLYYACYCLITGAPSCRAEKTGKSGHDSLLVENFTCQRF